MADFEKAVLDLLLGKDTSPDGFEEYSGDSRLGFILQYAETNHLLFALASKLGGRKYLSQSAAAKVNQILGDERKLFLERVSLTKKAQKAFDKNNCPVILMKSFFPFPYTDYDVDCVAAQGDFSRCKKVLEENNFAMIKNRSYMREPFKRFFSVKDNRCFIHLHSKFSWDGVKYVQSKAVWKSKVDKEIDGTTISVPSPTYDFLITAAHALFENKCVYMSDFMNIITLVESGQMDWDELLQMADELNWKSGLLWFSLQIEALHKKISDKPLLPRSILRDNEIHIPDGIIFPFVLNKTFSSSFKKLFLDIGKFRFRRFARQLFSYTVVDYCLYKRISNSRKWLETLYVDFLQRD